MIGKFITGKSFGGLIGYLLSDKKIKATDGQQYFSMVGRAEILKYNNVYGNKDEIIKQFKEVSRLQKRQSKPVLHLALSFSPDDHLSEKTIFDIVDDMAVEFGFTDNQYLLIRHKDTDESHRHVHLCVNRISLDGKTNVSDSNSYRRMASFCRKTELKYGLEQVLSPKKFLPKNQQMIPRKDKRKQALKEQISIAVIKSKSIDQLIALLAEKNIQTMIGRGIVFMDEKLMKVKGSEVNYSLSKIQKLVAANNRTEQPRIINLSQHRRQLKL